MNIEPAMHPLIQAIPRHDLPIRCIAFATLLAVLAGCAGTPKPKAARPRHAQVSPVVRDALNLEGTPYLWGGNSPGEGFDCSGFVKYVYQRHGIRLPRTAHQMASALPSLDSRRRQPGDLVFFNTTGEPYSHVGIYIGNDAFIHSSSSKGQVTVSSLSLPYWWEHFLGIRRPSLLDRWLGSAGGE
jgi:cell wall-associated NlpC family hydrolase